ncbi:hypothetical protein RI367_008743 [Sorochytrium milnesiophthora]
MVPKCTSFDGRPENRVHFVGTINNFLELTLSQETPTSVKFSDLIASQPHLLEDYDAFLLAFNRNYAGYDLELEARHA